MFKRAIYEAILRRLQGPRRFIQVLGGPRQTGKTTLAMQLMEGIEMPSHYGSADEPALKGEGWIEEQWEAARLRMASGGSRKPALLVLDEVQKIPQWAEAVKRLWDEDSAAGRSLHVIVLGSSPLLMQQGLSESLAGRFEITRVSHWSFAEMRDAFDWNVDRYIVYGGYPGSAELIEDHSRWCRYVADSLIETTISRDILLMSRVDKPALLRRLFDLGCNYSGQVLSFQKMLGQLEGAGNTTTLAHYLALLESAGLLAGLQKYAGGTVRRRASSPKLQVLNTALKTSSTGLSLDDARGRRDYWGRLVESAVGATLINGARGIDVDVFYWSRKNREVDFVLCRRDEIVPIEVKSGAKKTSLPGMDDFCDRYDIKRRILVGKQGIPVEEFLLTPVGEWLR